MCAMTIARNMSPNSASPSAAGDATSTWCPRPSSNLPVAATDSRASGWSSPPAMSGPDKRPTRNFSTFAPTSLAYGRNGNGGVFGSPASYPLIASITAAVSRTDRVTQPSTTPPIHDSPIAGPRLTRPLLGFRPTRPHSLAGMRMDPPPSLACATATQPALTPAADPPLEPPVECSVFHGLRAGPYASGSVVMVLPNSGTFVRPMAMKPARRNRS